MKATEEFKRVIKAELDKRAAEDDLFAACYAKPNKNIDQCIDFIFQEVEKSGCHGFDDEEIYGMAVHYYEEDDLGAIKGASGSVVVNHHIDLSDEEKEALRESARKRFEDECLSEMRKRNKRVAEASKAAASAPAKEEKKQPQQLSLFDL